MKKLVFNSGLILRGTMAVIIHRGILFCETNELSSEPTETTQPPTPDQPNEPETSAPAMSIDEMKAEVVRLMNEERSNAGLPELEVLPELMDCAQAKARDFKAISIAKETKRFEKKDGQPSTRLAVRGLMLVLKEFIS